MDSKQYTLTDSFVNNLVKIASKQTDEEHGEDSDEGVFNVYYYCGGNFDDAYSIGRNDEEIYSARAFLDELGVEY